ncbi:MAG TPA: XRE family transcriptional regulator [Lachnospiraceae bacterium]|jgi:DNA-binding XRE family transcriptional regulator|nr:XRE family transcriptional regulator [Lachnospiraceae bacterium]
MRKNLQEARQKAGMTQQQMADKLRINERYYKAIESGERLGGIWIWDMLEDIFDVNQRFLREIHLDIKDNQ